MNILPRLPFATVVACALFSASPVLSIAADAPLTAAADVAEERGELVHTVPVPAGMSGAEVREAMIGALYRREWKIKTKTDNSAVGYLNHREHEATATLVHEGGEVKLYMTGYKLNGKGVRKKAEINKRWAEYLRRSVVEKFGEKEAMK